MNRTQYIEIGRSRAKPWDMVVIGGGATGAAVALDAATRGLEVVLLEQGDFGQGTSSRSTKLAHGGVRYLKQGQISLVRGALRERGYLLRHAPHLVQNLALVVPAYTHTDAAFYYAGLKLYDWLSGRLSLGPSRLLSPQETLTHLPTLRMAGLRGGVLYHDGQFDDARLLLCLIQTAADHGACVVNYARAIGLLKDSSGKVSCVRFRDEESGREHLLPTRCVINAAGPFVENIRRWGGSQAPPLTTLSQGTHLVLSAEFLPSQTALLVPQTRDGRVLFLIPWQNRLLAGTTETPVEWPALAPQPQPQEIEFILQTSGEYLVMPPERADIRSAFAGLRTLVRQPHQTNSSQLARDHRVEVTAPGLVTVTGGKWTTCRQMAQDAVDTALSVASLGWRACITDDLPLHGADDSAPPSGPLSAYGSDAPAVQELAEADPSRLTPLHPDLPVTPAQIIWAARVEMARTVEDVLARRTRALFLDARAARDIAPAVANLLARELGFPPAWEKQQVLAFQQVAAAFLPPSAS